MATTDIDGGLAGRPPMVLNSNCDFMPEDGVALSALEEEMYQTIDDIDTYDDLAKENFKLFRNLVMRRIEKFHETTKDILFCDGYKVVKVVPKEYISRRG